MPTADELLTTEVCDDILTVDLESRQILIPSSVKNIGVESDDKVRILHFRLPRYYCTTDLSEFAIRINYENAKGGGDLYDVKNPTVEDDLIKFDWIVGRYAVTYKGNVVFNVCLRDATDGVINREFNTTIATLPVLQGLETGEAIIEQHVDILEQWRADLFGTGDTVEQQIRDVGAEVSASIPASVNQYVADNADALKGDNGATFTPAVSTSGVISWTNDKGLSNPAAVNIKGPKGDTGAGFKVLDYYSTASALASAVTNPSAGDAYGVGTAEPYDIYIYSPTKGWVNNGALQGAKGESGATFTPSVSSAGELSWTNDKGLTNPTPVNIKGDKGESGKGFEVVTTSGSGSAYVAAVSNIESLTAGASFIMVPHTVSTSVQATLNVNSLGAKIIRRGISINTSTTVLSDDASWLAANKPILVTYNGTYWIANLPRPYATDIYGQVPIASGGTGANTAAAARTNLEVYSKTEVDAAITAAIGNAIGGSY